MTTTNKAAALAATFLDRLATDLAQGNSETLTQYLATMARFHRYSYCNNLLIFFQKPEAQRVAGFATWKKMGRWVKPGEKGIAILAPSLRKVRSNDDESDDNAIIHEVVASFITVYVFDVAQTDGEPLPAFQHVTGDVGCHLARLKDMVLDKGIGLAYTADLGGALGISHGKAITILSGLEPAQELQTLAHELAHELLHRGDRRSETTRNMRELEAEAVAYVVTCACGLDNVYASWDYIRLYEGNVKLLSESLQHIHGAATEILDYLGLSRT